MPVKEFGEIMDQDVSEATQALKGMLGIGSATPTKPTIAACQATAEGADQQNSNSKTSKRKKNNRKKKTTEETKPVPKTPQNKNSNRAETENAESKGKNRSSNSKKKGQKKNNRKGPSENFAWSAFQSSPDASKLPIPAFASPVQERKPLSTAHEQEADKFPTPTPSNVSTIDTAPGQQSNESAEKPASVPPDTPQAAHCIANSQDESLKTEPQAQEPEEVTAGGVNLAELASRRQEEQQQLQQLQPHSTTTGQLVGAPMHPNHQQHPRTMMHPGHYGQQQSHHYSRPPYHYPPPPPPPPGYMTIQVQVPPVLMPGRQMVVSSPAGYPVQIAVPEGIPEGVIIPVHVPTGPPLHVLPPGAGFHSPSHRGGYYSSNNNSHAPG